MLRRRRAMVLVASVIMAAVHRAARLPRQARHAQGLHCAVWSRPAEIGRSHRNFEARIGFRSETGDVADAPDRAFNYAVQPRTPPATQQEDTAMTDISRRATLAGAAASALTPFVKPAPANAAAPLADKQTPSFYRYNVGTHQVTVVCDGVVTINLPDNYAPGTSKDDIGKVFAEHHLPTDKVTHSFNPIVVNTGPKLVVIDTG